jgi:7-cyano-7-deazaguanine synthase in queuosine biosynthesis
MTTKRAQLKRASRKGGTVRFDVVESRASPRSRRIGLGLGQNVQLSYDVLENYCVTELSPVDVDLVVLLGTIAFVDRAIRRRRSATWTRSFDLSLPVHDLERWRAPSVAESLTDLLSHATGDAWSISFRQRRSRDERALQLRLKLRGQQASAAPVVIPFSGGIDSWAAIRAAQQSSEDIWLVSTMTNTALAKLVERVRQYSAKRVRGLVLPIAFHDLPPGSEPTYRTRTIMFFSLAALAAKQAGATRILIGENGQGALGSSLITLGLEHPFVSLHPSLTARLAHFLGVLWERPIRFEHPFLFHTKAEMIEQAVASGAAGLATTFSCSYNTTRHRQLAERVHCGICGNCMLRRLAVFNAPSAAAVLEDKYLWQDLRAASLEESAEGRRTAAGLPVRTSSHDVELAETSVLLHEQFAELAAASETPALRRSIAEIALALRIPREEAKGKLEGLIRTHAREWRTFTESLGRASWVNACRERAA